MSDFKVYKIDGSEAGKLAMPAMFQVPVDEKLIHRYVTWVQSMLRSSIANTKTRGEVSGGGKKPWKQKGTGRARSGSNRNPIWRHGGTIFGPLAERNFETRMPRGERRKAFMSALSAKAEAKQVVVLDDLTLAAPKTREMVAILDKLPVGKKVLHIAGATNLPVFASTRNLPRINSTTVAELNVLDVMNHDTLLLTKADVAALEQHFTPQS
jgi:large subunit ribosomal protein L4